MIKLHRKATCTIFALLLLSVSAFFIANAILPCLAVSGLGNDNENSHKRIVDPDSTAMALVQEMPSMINALGRNLDTGPLKALSGMYELALDIQDQAELISRYIQKQNSRIDDLTALQEALAFIHYSTKYEVPIDLVIAVANTESHFDPEAKSGHGSAGVMQVTWRVHEALLKANGIYYEEDLHDPVKGIAAGTLLVSRYLKAYGTPEKALGRYYGGSASVYWSRISRNLARLKKYTM